MAAYRNDGRASADLGFRSGDCVVHKLTNAVLLVLSIGREQIECRTPDLKTSWFYPFEIELKRDEN